MLIEERNLMHQDQQIKKLMVVAHPDDELIFDDISYPRKDGKILYEGKWRPEGWPGFKWEQKAYRNS